MPEVEEKVSVFSGIKSSYPSNGAALQSGDAEDMLNFMIRKARLRKIWGAADYATIATGSGAIRWIDRFLNRWIVQRAGSISFETAESSQVFSEMGTIEVDDESRIVSDKWRGNIYLSNGLENKFYDNQSAQGIVDFFNRNRFGNVGLTPPGNGLREDAGLQPELTLSEQAGTGVANQGFKDSTAYEFLIIWWDNLRDVYSLPNGAEVQEDGLWLGNKPATITTSAGTGIDDRTIRVDITNYVNAGFDTNRVTHWVALAREVGVDADFKRVGNSTVVPGSATANFNTSGVSPALGRYTQDIAPTDGVGTIVLDESISPPPSGKFYQGILNGDVGNYGPRFIREHNEQLFFFGVRFPGLATEVDGEVELFLGKANGIAYASEVENFDYIRDNYNVGRETDQEDTGLEKFRNILYFIKSGSCHYLDGTNPLNYSVRACDSNRGFTVPGSIQATTIGIIGLSLEGFGIITSPGPIEIISEDIFNKISGINLLHKDKITSSFDEKEGKYECHVPCGANTNVSRVFVYDVNLKTWEVYSKRVAGALKYSKDSQMRKVALLGDKGTGELYSIANELQATISGDQIKAHWRSKQFDFGYPGRLKRLKFIRIKARSTDEFSLDVDIVLDAGQQQTVTLGTQNSESVYATWADAADDSDGGEFGESDWSGATVPVKFEILAEGVARNFQIIIKESGTDAASANFEIEEIVLVADLLGR
jgi:hypothetical protein